jgi:hypothetical protein
MLIRQLLILYVQEYEHMVDRMNAWISQGMRALFSYSVQFSAAFPVKGTLKDDVIEVS